MSGHAPEVAPSVLTLTRDRTSHLRHQILGLAAGSVLPQELVVVVMGGEDPEPHLPDTAFPVRTERLETDGLPLAAARNLAARRARCEELIFLDVDCIPGSTLVGSYGAALQDLDGILMGAVRYLPPGVPRGPWDDAVLEAVGERHPGRPDPPQHGLASTDRYGMFWSLSFAVRRRTFLDVLDGFDEEMVGYGGEDTDLALRAQKRGVTLALVGGAWAFHQHHETYDPPLQHLRSIVANARRFRRRWERWPMEGWLAAFAELGLLRWDPNGDLLELVRDPGEDEMAAARRDTAVPSREIAVDGGVDGTEGP